MKFTAQVRAEYDERWRAMAIIPAKLPAVDAAIDRVLKYRHNYEQVSKLTGVPWYVIAAIDEMESGGACKGHLHNGDPLTARTVHVPANRPAGDPPFTWQQSALDALQHDGLAAWSDWSVPGISWCLEKFNGFGYRSSLPGRPIPSPYLYSFATLPGWDGRGKYVADGVFSPSAVSAQVGALVLLRRMADRKIISLPSGAVTVVPGGPAPSPTIINRSNNVSIITNSRFIASIAGLIGVVVSLVWPGTSEDTVVRIVSNALIFFAGLYQPSPAAPVPQIEAGAGAGSVGQRSK